MRHGSSSLIATTADRARRVRTSRGYRSTSGPRCRRTSSRSSRPPAGGHVGESVADPMASSDSIQLEPEPGTSRRPSAADRRRRDSARRSRRSVRERLRAALASSRASPEASSGGSQRIRVAVVLQVRAAWLVIRSGWNVSTMTASSSVASLPIDASAVPGCGPCGIPAGWSVNDEMLHAAAAHEVAGDVVDDLVAVDVRVVVRRRDRQRVVVELARHERADDEVPGLRTSGGPAAAGGPAR